MRSSQGSADTGDVRLPSVPLAADAGVRLVLEPAADGFTALDDLMSVVEAFCRSWPGRENFGPMHEMRL